jgi:hypothetical protein
LAFVTLMNNMMICRGRIYCLYIDQASRPVAYELSHMRITQPRFQFASSLQQYVLGSPGSISFMGRNGCTVADSRKRDERDHCMVCRFAEFLASSSTRRETARPSSCDFRTLLLDSKQMKIPLISKCAMPKTFRES